MADPVAGSLRVIRALGGAADDAPRVIRAYHGSPHSFSRFDASKIGTGEGAQSYGHGLYFAGNEGVARHYRDILAQDRPYQSAEEAAAEYLGSNGGDAARALHVLNMHAMEPTQYGYVTADQQNIIRRARDLIESGATITPRERVGHMYEVEIGYPEEALLDWHASLSGQPEAVQAYAGRGGSYHGLGGRPGDGERFWWHRRNSLGPQEAARELLEAGIPGIKYYDAGSRRTGQGTRNYVMFPGTEDRIRILRQYGLLPPLVAAGINQEE